MLDYIENTPVNPSSVPRGTPTRKHWHVERRHVVERVFKALAGEGVPLVGLYGSSGSGKTTALSEIVRSTKMREAFSDRVVWLTVNAGAKERLPALMMQLARMVFERIGGCVGDRPASSEDGDGAAYVKKYLGQGYGSKGLRCLVVADNVWEEEVVSELMTTGMWVLLSTRKKELVTGARGVPVGVDELPEAEAKSVLRRAAELPPEARLPDNAVDLIDLCGRVAMNLAFVGRWSTVRGMQGRKAWSDAAKQVRAEMAKIEDDPADNDSEEQSCSKRRKAILRAGFEDLAVGSDDERVRRLYLSLAVMPDGQKLTVRDAAILLFDREFDDKDEASVGLVVGVLERWSVLDSGEGMFSMHDSHSEFAREKLKDHGGVRKYAVKRWAKHISSLNVFRSNEVFALKSLWLALERVDINKEVCSETRPYVDAVAEVDDSDPITTLEKLGWFQEARGDWDGARNTCERLLRLLEGDDPKYYLTLRSLTFCAWKLGDLEEKNKWEVKKRDCLPFVAAKVQSKIDKGEMSKVDDAITLSTVGKDMSMSSSTPDEALKAEKLLEHSLHILETKLGEDTVRVAYVLFDRGYIARKTKRLVEAEKLLRRSLNILQDKHAQAVREGFALYNLGIRSMCQKTRTIGGGRGIADALSINLGDKRRTGS